VQEFNPHELDLHEFIHEVHSFEFWFQAVGGYLNERPYGRDEKLTEVPLAVGERETLITTLCNYCVGETAALEAASGMIEFAPNRASKIFLATQVADEARHLEVFLHRLEELGIEDPEAEVDRRANADLLTFKRRLLELVSAKDWNAAVFAQNVVLETMESTVFHAHLESADPITKSILDGVLKDERRHLGFGENDLGRRLANDPSTRTRLRQLRLELDGLVLGSFEGVMNDIGVPASERSGLGNEYLAAIERLGITS
jgi:Methane/Phenol/Alkene Hydroxylase